MTEADTIINVGVSGPGVVKTALEQVRGKDFETLCEMIKRTAFKVDVYKRQLKICCGQPRVGSSPTAGIKK